MTYTFSIVTICFNNLADLQKTIASVDFQHLLPHEHIIINGSSNPDIENCLSQNAQPNYRLAVHESDHGIADAFNKGISKSTGEIVLLLNAGDELAASDTLSIVQDTFRANPDITWLHGKYNFKRAGIWVILGKPYEREKLYRGMRSICHQTMYVKKVVYEKYGGFSSEFKICMDYDYLVRMRDEPFIFVEKILANFAPGGISMLHSKQILKENETIYRKHIGFSFKQVIWNFRLNILITLMNSPFGKILYRLKVWLGLENM
jgi:glycosyltransferase involved in cell wall biosynthesis